MADWNLTGTTSTASPVPWERDDAPGNNAKTDGVDEAPYSVSDAVAIAAGAVAKLPEMVILGEVTGFRGPNARSKHCYFQIKDESAVIDCKIWRGVYSRRAFDLRDGMQVLFRGRFDIYKPRGAMSFIASKFSLAGEGLLRQQVAELARKLEREGLMDPARKRHIPIFCQRIAVVTSLSGAVIDDVKRTLRRRNPLVEIICVGAKVQGEGAPAELIEGLRRAAAIEPAVDCILLVRGGGSFEDLMTFNDEALARAVAECPVPVVTGIGHEPDTSICDMVSDRRSSTPTAAAESVAPAMSELADVLDARIKRLVGSMGSMLERTRVDLKHDDERRRRAWATYIGKLSRELEVAADRPCMTDPTTIVDRRRIDIIQSQERFIAAAERSQARFASNLAPLASGLFESQKGFAGKEHACALAAARLKNEGRQLLSAQTGELGRYAASLDALSPLKVLGRGYAIAYGDDGAVKTRAESFTPGEDIQVRFGDGRILATVDSVLIDTQR